MREQLADSGDRSLNRLSEVSYERAAYYALLHASIWSAVCRRCIQRSMNKFAGSDHYASTLFLGLSEWRLVRDLFRKAGAIRLETWC